MNSVRVTAQFGGRTLRQSLVVVAGKDQAGRWKPPKSKVRDPAVWYEQRFQEGRPGDRPQSVGARDAARPPPEEGRGSTSSITARSPQ
jgi:hypothetical protein